jgi:tryptophanyl-tRNA synthetase
MAEKVDGSPGEPPSVAALSIAETATQSAEQASEQHIDPWNVSAGVDEQGNAKQFDYEAISRYFFFWDMSILDSHSRS